MKYTHRYIARIVMEAETPLFVGSGESSLTKDALIQKDHFGFPMILGTSLTGVLRHSLEEQGKDDKWNSFFGFQKGDEGEGSQLKVSSAYLVLNKDGVAEGIELTEKQEALLVHFDNLPSRQHVKITDKGVAMKNGLFDNEVVYKGCRFIFEMEVKGNEKDEGKWTELLSQLYHPLFRIGGGTRNGYGKLKIHSLNQKTFDLTDINDFDTYLSFDASFNNAEKTMTTFEPKEKTTNLTHYQLRLKPDDFFIFSVGQKDDEVDNKPITETIVKYDYEGKMVFVNHQTLIPATSIKGAISHRTAFYYNKILGEFVDVADKKPTIGVNNPAVRELFGAEAGANEITAQRGKIVFNDLYESTAINDKIFNHVAIDRFTGGAIAGALFSEKVTRIEDELVLDIYSENVTDEKVAEAFKEALQDICKGLLPLGGMTTKGHGIFTGSLIIDGEKKYSYA